MQLSRGKVDGSHDMLRVFLCSIKAMKRLLCLRHPCSSLVFVFLCCFSPVLSLFLSFSGSRIDACVVSSVSRKNVDARQDLLFFWNLFPFPRFPFFSVFLCVSSLLADLSSFVFVPLRYAPTVGPVSCGASSRQLAPPFSSSRLLLIAVVRSPLAPFFLLVVRYLFLPWFAVPVFAEKMFVISLLQDAVSVLPETQMKNQGEVLRKAIEEKYLNKVVVNCGLAVAFYELRRIQSATIRSGDGSARYKVEFSLVFFRPFQGEILEGTLMHSDNHGLRISLGFFHDVYIPAAALREPKGFNAASERWWWGFEDHELEYAPLQQAIRFRVQEIRFDQALADGNGGAGTQELVAGAERMGLAPMVVLGAVDDDGLGMKTWWQ
ncbi:RNA polymerase Rpb7, N-terminal domain-containing protein [Toxoplasma gondii VEG]|uniref:RNA polymerase Rpb7, N-terminal domain-containing protein n=1 Tax=Toxoplasma gondii (strain ATCC 50861 / VEG) TaxID=432359 RepID=V4ZP59_TOXGV|nr:RNA polymerase Rpb7, N-terminal domain-containing protein [Toxoplasma gondii VEG]